MARTPKVQSRVFLDTSYLVALTMKSDRFHKQALGLSKEIAAASTSFVTTQAVVLEVGNSLSKTRHRQSGWRLLQFILTDPTVEVVATDAESIDRGLQLFRSRRDKEWGLVDCISFVVMQDRGLKEALTSDEHFEQAGFVALLRT
jgi:predicted nucleic acid-binding protein